MTMTARRLLRWTVYTLPLAALLIGTQTAFPQQPERTCDPHELEVRINSAGNVVTPGDADGQLGCPFVITVRNESSATRQVSMNLERDTPGGQRQEFDLCQGAQLKDARPAPPGSTEITCAVRPNLFAGLGNTSHPRDRNDSQGRPLERGFKYTLTVDDEVIDPSLVIKR